MFKKLLERYKLWKEIRVRNKERAIYKNSNEPWVSVISHGVDTTKGMKLDLDWNEAFIVYLRAAGVPGSRDEDMVAYWITSLHQHLLSTKDE